MANVKKPSDLMTILPYTEKRLTRVERQMSVSRTESISTVAAGTTSSATAAYLTGGDITKDSITIQTTATCLIHIYFEVTFATSAGTASIYVRDHDAASGAGVDTIVAQTSTSVAAKYAPANAAAGVIVPLGNLLTFANTSTWTSAANAHMFSLVFSTTAGTATASARKLFGWVQPF